MARSTLLLFGALLTVWGLFSVVGGMDRGDGAGGDSGHVGDAARGAGAGVVPPRILEEGESSRPKAAPGDTPTAEEGQGSGGEGSDDTFRDLPELSGGGRAARLRQSTLLEAFASSSHIGQPDLGMDEEVEGEDCSSSEEEQQAKEKEQAEDAEGEPAMEGRRPVKRRRHFSRVGATGWSTLIGDGPLEEYRRRPSAMLRFKTIAARQVN